VPSRVGRTVLQSQVAQRVSNRALRKPNPGPVGPSAEWSAGHVSPGSLVCGRMAERTKATVLKTVFGLPSALDDHPCRGRQEGQPSARTAVVAEPFEVGTDLARNLPCGTRSMHGWGAPLRLLRRHSGGVEGGALAGADEENHPRNYHSPTGARRIGSPSNLRVTRCHPRPIGPRNCEERRCQVLSAVSGGGPTFDGCHHHPRAGAAILPAPFGVNQNDGRRRSSVREDATIGSRGGCGRSRSSPRSPARAIWARP